MSFDLYLYKDKNSKIIEQDVSTYLNNCSPFINNDEYPNQWYYSNNETGVYFIIEQNGIEEAESIENFDNFISLNFSCFINYFRPTYFSLEIFPLIDKLIEDLDLYILNPQDFEIDIPHKFEKGYLERQWIEQNNKFCFNYYKEYNLDYYPLEESNYVWEYMCQRNNIQDCSTEDIFVCGIFFIKNKYDNSIHTFAVWTEGIPIIIPPVDFIVIRKKYRKIFKTIEESGLVSYELIMDKFKDYFKPLEHEIPNLKILNSTDAARIKKEFNKIKIWKTTDQFGTVIAKDSFVNAKRH